jgi:hypothetical protein
MEDSVFKRKLKIKEEGEKMNKGIKRRQMDFWLRKRQEEREM